VPAGELTTDGCTRWNAALTWRMKASGADLLWYARLDNASNRLAYSATSILTQIAQGKVPLPGRSLKLGCRQRSSLGRRFDAVQAVKTASEEESAAMDLAGASGSMLCSARAEPGDQGASRSRSQPPWACSV
jgi:hypothetical protein